METDGPWWDAAGAGAPPLETLSVAEAEALWALVQSGAQAEAVVRRLGCRAGWRYEGTYGYRRAATWVQGWQFVHHGVDAGLYFFEVGRDVRTGQVWARLVDATPRPAAPAAGQERPAGSERPRARRGTQG